MTFLRRYLVKTVSKIGKPDKHTTYASRTLWSKHHPSGSLQCSFRLPLRPRPEKIVGGSAADIDSETKITFLRRYSVKTVSKIGKPDKHTNAVERTVGSRFHQSGSQQYSLRLPQRPRPVKIVGGSAAHNDSEIKMTFLRHYLVKTVSKIGKPVNTRLTHQGLSGPSIIRVVPNSAHFVRPCIPDQKKLSAGQQQISIPKQKSLF